jgi:hypothetical protein
VIPIEGQYFVLRACLQCFILGMLTLGWKEVERENRGCVMCLSSRTTLQDCNPKSSSTLYSIDSLKTILRLYSFLRSPHPSCFKRVVLF